MRVHSLRECTDTEKVCTYMVWCVGVTIVFPYIEVINMQARRFTVCVADISSVEERQTNKSYADIVLKTTGRTIETGNSYTDVYAKLYNVYNDNEE